MLTVLKCCFIISRSITLFNPFLKYATMGSKPNMTPPPNYAVHRLLLIDFASSHGIGYLYIDMDRHDVLRLAVIIFQWKRLAGAVYLSTGLLYTFQWDLLQLLALQYDLLYLYTIQ